MKNEILTEKERDILIQFLWQNTDYMANPSKIETDTKKSVTRAWAIKICKRFYKEGIFDYKKIKPRRYKYKTEHYYLRKDKKAFSKIFKLFLNSYHHLDSINFLQTPYSNSVINNSFVKEILYGKKIDMKRAIELIYWKEKERRELFKIIKEKNKNILDTNTKKLTYEKYLKHIEKNVNEKSKIKLNLFINPICLNLPIFPDNISKHERNENLKNMNKKIFNEYGLQWKLSGIDHHYEIWQEQKLILPILALIKTSPQALSEFLFGDWADDKIVSKYKDKGSYSIEGYGMLEPLLYRLIFKAIADYTIYRWGIHTYGNLVIFASIRPKYGFKGLKKEEALLELLLENGSAIYYDAGFDTTPPFGYEEDTIEILPISPEDCWVRIKYEEAEKHSSNKNKN